MPAVRALIASVDGDLENLQPEQFIVARDGQGNIVGCGRLKPYDGFTELASIVVNEEWRSSGVGREVVQQLVERHQGVIYLTILRR